MNNEQEKYLEEIADDVTFPPLIRSAIHVSLGALQEGPEAEGELRELLQAFSKRHRAILTAKQCQN